MLHTTFLSINLLSYHLALNLMILMKERLFVFSALSDSFVLRWHYFGPIESNILYNHCNSGDGNVKLFSTCQRVQLRYFNARAVGCLWGGPHSEKNVNRRFYYPLGSEYLLQLSLARVSLLFAFTIKLITYFNLFVVIS